MIAWRIHQLDVTTSTNDDAKRAAISGENEGYVAWGLRQTAGRGRHGRVWESPEGNLYCSVLLSPPALSANLGHYSFMAALALSDTVRHFLPSVTVQLKWPNDVLVKGKKISGILLEPIEQGIIIGMGLNLRHHPQNALYPTTSLEASGAQNPKLSVALNRLLEALGIWYEHLKKEGFAPLRTAWLENAVPGVMTVKLPHETIIGHLVDLDLHGHLHLHLADGTERVIASGDVFLPPKD